MARERSEFSGAMLASTLLHAGVIAAALISWPWARQLPMGAAVPVNIVANAPSTNLAVVAPSIAEALFATAIGLIAAIPAYIAYNKFSTDAGKYAGRLEGFADDLSTAIQRRLAERG